MIGIKSEAVLEVLAENSEICNLKARTLLMKENEKVDAISFLYKKGGLVKSYYEKSDGKKQVHCFAYFPGEALVGIMNLDKQITSFLTRSEERCICNHQLFSSNHCEGYVWEKYF